MNLVMYAIDVSINEIWRAGMIHRSILRFNPELTIEHAIGRQWEYDIL
jgi:hypothetical protein